VNSTHVVVTAAVVQEPHGAHVLQDVQLAPPGLGEVLVEVRASGVCHTDLGAQAGAFPTPLPCILGHEGAGIVAAVGPSVTRVEVGDRVATSFASCGACDSCTSGAPAYCREFLARNFLAQRGDGATARSSGGDPIGSQFFGQSSFATYAVCPERSVVRVDGDVPFEIVAPLGCGVQTGVGAVLDVLRPASSSSIAILGAGAVGLSAVMAARLTGCETIVAVDLHESRLALARELGATHVIDARRQDPVEIVRRITGGGADSTLECTGVPAVLRQAVDMLGGRGTCGIVGAPPFGTEIGFDVNDLIAGGKTVRGIVEGDSDPATRIPQLVELWRQGDLPLERLVTTFAFPFINDAVSAMTSGEVIKPVVLLDRTNHSQEAH
jgi:aryl-alcohol dehydrogenase